jgi:hypothetical protein
MALQWERITETKRGCEQCDKRLPKGKHAIVLGISVMKGSLWLCSVRCVEEYNRRGMLGARR